MTRNMTENKNTDRIGNFDQIDQAIHIVGVRHWMVWAVLLSIIILALIWSIWGRVNYRVNGMGVLLPAPTHIYQGVSLGHGLIRSMPVKVGSQVFKGEVLAVLDEPIVFKQLVAAKMNLSSLEAMRDRLRYRTKKFKQLQTSYYDALTSTLDRKGNRLDHQLSVLRQLYQAQSKLHNQHYLSTNDLIEQKIHLDSLENERDNIKASLANNNIEHQQSLNKEQSQLSELDLKIIEVKAKINQLTVEYSTKYVRSPSSGHIGEILFSVGDAVQIGDRIMTVISLGKHAQVLSFFPALEGKKLKQGMHAFISPSVAKKEKYGSILGNIHYVSTYLLSEQAIEALVHNTSLLKLLSEQGTAVMAKIDLVLNKKNQSGYAWTSRGGPPFQITNGTLCQVSVVVGKDRPISLVLPFIRKWLGSD